MAKKPSEKEEEYFARMEFERKRRSKRKSTAVCLPRRKRN
jgi:hypothetical protein